ncbi:pH-response regulator protein palH/rim21 [Exophiala xenobiotica]|uniref:PH-response regulator protein palH/rim21 n=1 Tax=Lithohypha guttulata TaxID=1690604 RepID=A0ABR0JXN8_9EURO|nr:pH-response regulator protein palH/rim21 [Lithohypha guttulata]KAK5315954.1 pH-response regulator protein palH/rim21 [Exophiala xenobiotica]
MVRDGLTARQIEATATRITAAATAAASTPLSAIPSQAQSALCTVALPAGGILRFNETFSTILQDSITFESSCDDSAFYACDANTGNSTVVKSSTGEPFYASVAPQIYALATATIISYVLVVLVFITPRTFYVGGPGGGGANFLGLRNLVPGSGSSSVIGVGRRPLLQKIAAVTVAISLTIATADTFRVAEDQYHDGLMESEALVNNVIGSVEIRVVRVVSDTFLWLAQVQTLIRLFPRHKEKVTIKWLGFALVTCDTVFSILENFYTKSTLTRPRSFQDAIPALSYLFQMSISLIYASCVIYYSLSKRRFAFWHAKMRNILLVAALSLASVLIPVVFFVLDVSQPNIAVWGEYIRWVGAAAASVVVWEWVERIEALERDERKDGILGREVFDGDEMLNTRSDDNNKSNTTSTYFGFGRKASPDGDNKGSTRPIPRVRSRMPFRHKKTGSKSDAQLGGRQDAAKVNGNVVEGLVAHPAQIATPISRSDNTSAASTLYQVRYHNVSSPSPAIPEEPVDSAQGVRQPPFHINAQMLPQEEGESSTLTHNTVQEIAASQPGSEPLNRDNLRNRQTWQAVANPFKRKRADPPAEVAAQMAASNVRRSPAQTYHNLRDRLNVFRTIQKDRIGRKRAGPSPPMPVTVIPAQPRASRVTIPDETPHVSRQPSVQQPQQDRTSSIPRSRGASMPVTVIPAPTRGGRTWSPDDLQDKDGSPWRQRDPGGTRSNEATRHSTPPSANDQSRDVHTARGALTFAESPTQAREHGHRSSPAHRSATGLRAPTIDSLNGRLGSTSPESAAAGSGSGSGSAGSGSGGRQRRGPGENGTLRPRSQQDVEGSVRDAIAPEPPPHGSSPE